jgi:hypothetical protein
MFAVSFTIKVKNESDATCNRYDRPPPTFRHLKISGINWSVEPLGGIIKDGIDVIDIMVKKLRGKEYAL